MCSRIAAVLALAVLSACGGGGGGGGGGAGVAGNAPLATGAVANSAALAMLSGRVTYASVPNPAGALDYSAIVDKPVRGALVEVLDAASGAVISSTQTDGAGAYSTPLAPGRMLSVRVRAQSSGAHWDLSVRDNTRDDAIHAIESPTFMVASGGATRDLRADSGWAGSRYAAQRAAAPFAILDALRTSMDKVLAAAPDTVFPALRAYWSVNNVPAYGDPALGQIGTTSFTRDAAGPVIYVLGKEDIDTDEYDASVIAHEWGHYYQDTFSRDDSPGGPHAPAERLDARLAFSEGWGNAWSGIALGRANYTDAVGARQAGGVNLDLASGPASARGWYREESVHAVLWQLNASAGFKPIHDAMAGPLRTGAALTDIHAFSAGLFQVAPGAGPALAPLLQAQDIAAAPGDPFGQGETNDGGLASALPLYRDAAVGAVTTVCVANTFGLYNKLGSFVYLRVAVPQARTYVIHVDGPPAADPDFSVYSGRLLTRSEGYGASETASVALPAGTAVLALNDANDSGTSTCLRVSIN